MIYQRTIANSVKVTGIGIHSGKRVSMVLHPAEANTGIIFKRIDLPNSKAVKADAFTVGTTENATTIGQGVEAIHTVEHLLSAFYGLGISNIFIEIDGPEVPIMDGSAASFVFLLKEIGIKNLNQSKFFMIILEPVRVEKDGKWAQIEPSDKLIIESSIVFAHPIIKTQKRVFEFSCENYIQEISRARTFGFMRDVDMLKRKGLARGGSLDNAVVLDDFRVMNGEGLRFVDEFIRHKILDTIGDVALMGYDIAGKITTYKSGHHIHNLLCRKLMEQKSAYEIVPASSLQTEVQESYQLPQMASITY